MQTQVQKEKSVRLGNGVLKINKVNVGLIRGAILDTEIQTAQVVAENGKLPPRQRLKGATFKATLLEINLENLKKIFGGELTTLEADSNSETNKKRKILTYDDLLRALELYPLEFLNTTDGKVFGVRFFKAYAKNSISLNFPSDEELDKTMELPVEFEAFPNEQGKMFEIIDEQDVE